jgi:16S rRNA processing protein RimM
MAKRYIGTILGTRGYQGEMRVGELDVDLININEGSKVNIGYSETFSRPFILTKWRQTKHSAKLELKGIDTEKKAFELIESGLFVDEEIIEKANDSPAFKGGFVGFEVFELSNNDKIGVIIEEWDLPANNVWLVETVSGSKIPIPVIDQVVKKIIKTKKKVLIEMIDGLEDLAL